MIISRACANGGGGGMYPMEWRKKNNSNSIYSRKSQSGFNAYSVSVLVGNFNMVDRRKETVFLLFFAR